MSMKHLVLFTALVANIFVIVRSGNDEHRVERIDPIGFRVMIKPHEHNNYHSLSFSGSKGAGSTDDIIGEFVLRSDGWWIYENTTVPLNPGDTLTYSAFQPTPPELCVTRPRYAYFVQYEATRIDA